MPRTQPTFRKGMKISTNTLDSLNRDGFLSKRTNNIPVLCSFKPDIVTEWYRKVLGIDLVYAREIHVSGNGRALEVELLIDIDL